MSNLEKLKSLEDRSELAKLLGFTPKGLSYILFKIDGAAKYRTFEIPKKTGGTRTIKAPEPQLALLQSRLAELLYNCAHERKQQNRRFWHASHGFQKGRTIVSNAEAHRRRRFVFNLDLEDFFGTINFGRVRGFFIHDTMFELKPAVATAIAQIACHDNLLPQGSPCSPVISNFIGNILDLRLLALARDAHCTYTRYADDLTFSTNEILFPTEIAVNTQGAEWVVGKKLAKTIKETGFTINSTKTRMSVRQSRQVVTGLVVNAKPNINQNYYRSARAMCSALFQTGQYHRPSDEDKEMLTNLNPLEGILSHIYFVKLRRDRPYKVNKAAREAGEFNPPASPVTLYKKFLFYKYFAAPKAPLIVTEGVTDITYMQCAIRALAAAHPRLATIKGGKVERAVNFLKPSGTSRDVLNLGHGSGGQAGLISQYANGLKDFKHRPLEHPVIVLCDNDDGAKTIFSNAKKKCTSDISSTTTEDFYYLGDNLYLVKIPEGTTPHPREIEELFEPALLATLVDGKPFNPKKEHADSTHYGKKVFAEHVVRKNTGTINFSGFDGLLTRLDNAIAHYETVKAAKPGAATVVPDAAAAGP